MRKTLRRLLICFLSYYGTIFADPDAGEKAFREGHYEDASREFLEAEVKNPEDLRHSYNRALSQLMEKKYQEAASGFARASSGSDQNLAAKAWYNLALTQIATGNLEEAIRSLEASLKAAPEDQQARDNLEWSRKKLEEMKKQQEQDQNKQEQDQNKQEQDQNKQEQEQDQNKQEQDQNKQEQDQNKQEQDQNKQEQSQNKQEQNSSKDQEGSDKEANDSRPPPTEEKSDTQTKAKKGEISKETAERMLRSLEDHGEYFLPPSLSPQGKSGKADKEKDW